MHLKKIKQYIFVSFKILLSILVYLFFLLYTPLLYKESTKFMTEDFFNSRTIVVGPTSLKVKVADSEAERITGLSGRKDLKEDEGMFFEFEKSDKHGIWMKDMNFPLDIIWFDEYGTIVYVAKEVDPKTYPSVFRPTMDTKYVLEVNAGFFDANNLMIGDTVDLY